MGSPGIAKAQVVWEMSLRNISLQCFRGCTGCTIFCKIWQQGTLWYTLFGLSALQFPRKTSWIVKLFLILGSSYSLAWLCLPLFLDLCHPSLCQKSQILWNHPMLQSEQTLQNVVEYSEERNCMPLTKDISHLVQCKPSSVKPTLWELCPFADCKAWNIHSLSWLGLLSQAKSRLFASICFQLPPFALSSSYVGNSFIMSVMFSP